MENHRLEREFLVLNRGDMYEFQRRAAAFVREHARCALWLDLGLGKSVSTLTAVSDLLDMMEVRKVLVVAPLRVAQTVWTEEVVKWRHLRHLRVSVMVGSLAQRVAAYSRPADIYVTNVDALPWLDNHLRAERGICPWDMIVIDEASMFKSRDTRRFKIMRRLAAQVNRLVELTATPSPNSYLELWPQFYILDAGERLGPTLTGFRERYFKLSDREGYKWSLRRGADTVIQSRIRDLTMTLKAADYLQMPPRLDLIHRIDLDEQERATYDRLERQAFARIGNAEIEAISAGALATKLLQLANGQVYDEAGVAHAFHGRKLERLGELLEEAGDEPVLVAYIFKSDAARIQAAFPHAVLLQKDPTVIERWNRGEVRLMLAHPASAGHGLNLQFGGSTICWYGLTWSLELYLQFIGRLHRQGQSRPVRVHHLIASGTIDEQVLGVLTHKHRTQSALLDAMKHRQAEVLASTPHIE